MDPVTDQETARARIGWMPDALGAWEALTVRETLVVAGRLYGATKQAAAARADELIAEVGLAELTSAPARVLSRGQKQLLGLARALVHHPRVLLLDEPASGLDPAARIALRELLRRLAGEGVAILISSHVLSELEEMVDSAVFVSRGATVAASGARARDWRIRLVGDPGDARESVARTLAGAEVRAERRSVLVAFSDEGAAAAALVALVQAGLPVAEFAPASGELEQAFLELKGAER